jgi:hypothetical protein
VTPLKEYCLIPLTQGQFAKVSQHRLEELRQWEWFAKWDATTRSFYAVRRVRLAEGWRQVSMHRQLLGLERGDKRQGDHKNHDTLDNTDGNLRISTPSQQIQNSQRRRSNKSGFKGVHLNKCNQMYLARIKLNGRQIYLGQRSTAEAAYRELYVPAALKHYGDFACLG